MDLQFTTAGHEYYEPLRYAAFSCEAMRENIVPDSCADIARIVDTTGQVCLTNREVTGDGRFCASGSVEVSVLYIPEKGGGPRSLHFQVPFQSYGESQGSGECEFLDIRGELRSIDTRLLNPRKVLTRADIVLYPVGCRHVSMSVCTGMTEEDGSVQLLRGRRQTCVIAAVREKEFTFTEELPLSQGRGGAEEVLSTRIDVRSTDCKLIGNKLVVKGIVGAAVLYREEEGRPVLLQQELPFSQVLEGGGLEEEWENEAAHRVLSTECRIGGGEDPSDTHTMTLTLLLRTRVTVWKKEEVGYIADLYSTSSPVVCRTEELELGEDFKRYTRRLNQRELLETGTAVKMVVDSEIVCGGAQLSGGELRVPAWARCLYMDENDMLGSVRRELSLVFPAEPGDPETMVLIGARTECRGDVMANIVPEGVELRFPAECAVTTACRRRCVCVSAAEGGEAEDDKEPKPSLVLRKMAEGETLWALAKQYRTTCQSILEVNEIADESQIGHDRLLLIPKAR